jgi:Ca2+-transporting ATPase
VEAVNLQVDESSLTGEPLTTKSVQTDAASHQGEEAYPSNVILRSTMVMNGHGVAVVTKVGDASEIGKVSAQATEKSATKTPLNIQLDKLASLISKIGSGVAIAAFVIFLTRDILTNSVWQGTNYFDMAQVVLNYFMMAVTLIVMAVPEGLPMAVTLALALNMRRMLKSNNLVRKLHASETMGAVTVICTDKTGTLTQNKMTVAEMKLVGQQEGEAADEMQFAISIAVNTTAELDGDAPIGNPTEGALLMWLKAQGYYYLQLRGDYQVQEQIPFSTEKKYMATTVTIEEKQYTFIKGAPEIIMAMCQLTDDDRTAIQQTLLGYQQRAMRTLAFAYGQGGFKDHGLTLQAVAAISDPVREDVPGAVSECQQAGIEVKVVTGDTSATAIEISRQIGVWDDAASEEGKVKSEESNAFDRWHITGPEFAALSDEEAYERVVDLRVMSRARPTDKQRLVKLLQKHGEVVAVTGDGTNDAPALNHAHVGLSLGSGTSVAKQASDITLLDDSFQSIASAIMWGRSLYKNIQRFLFFQLVVNLSALLLVLGGSFIGTEMPLTVTQILWINLIMDTFAAMALASLPPSHEVMEEKPRSPSAFIITNALGAGILFCGAAFFVIMFVFLLWCERHGAGSIVDVHELTLFFTTFVMLQFWNLFNAKCLGSDHSTFRHLWRDRGLLLVLGFILAGQWLIVTFGGRMFRTQPLSAAEWGIIIGATGVVVFLGGELYRGIKRLLHAKR